MTILGELKLTFEKLKTDYKSESKSKQIKPLKFNNGIAPSKEKRPPKKTLTVDIRSPILELLARAAQETPKTWGLFVTFDLVSPKGPCC